MEQLVSLWKTLSKNTAYTVRENTHDDRRNDGIERSYTKRTIAANDKN
jgi:hypothetical protein